MTIQYFWTKRGRGVTYSNNISGRNLLLNKPQCPCSFLQVEHIVCGENCSKPWDQGFLDAFTDDLAFDADHPMAQCDSITSNWCRKLWKTNMGIRALDEDKKFTEKSTPYRLIYFFNSNVLFNFMCLCGIKAIFLLFNWCLRSIHTLNRSAKRKAGQKCVRCIHCNVCVFCRMTH